jgi:hypothetical protein
MENPISLLPAYYQKAFLSSKEDLQVFIGDIGSPPYKKYFALDHQKAFIDAMRTGQYEEGWFSGGNSAGKTWTAKFMAAQWGVWKIKPNKPWINYEEFVHAPYNILCTGPEQKQAMELWEKIEQMFKESPVLKFFVEEIYTSTKRKTHPYIKLKNGTVIDCVGLHDKGKHVEGEAFDLILINEPADVRSLEHVITKVLTPRTWRRGGVISGFGTPKGKGEYWLIVRKGIKPETPECQELLGGRNPYYDPSTFTMFADARQNPFAEQEKVSKFINSRDSATIKERVEGKFIDESTLAFPDNHIEECINEGLKLPILSSNGHFYITGVDFGRKEDYTVAVTLDITSGRPPFTIVNFYRKGGGVATWEEILSDLGNIFRDYYGEFVCDSTASAGDMQMEWLKDMGISYQPYQFAGSPAKKANLITNLQRMLGNKEIQMPYIPQLREELHSYPRNMEDKDMETDSVMALALACFGAYEYGPLGEVEPVYK